MHRIVGRLLRKLGLRSEEPPAPEQWRAFLARVDSAFAEVDQNRYTVERSLILMSEEMQALQRRQQESYEARQSAILRAQPDLIFLLDEDGRYLEVMAGNDNLLAKGASELLGRLLSEVLPLASATLFLRVIGQALQSGQKQVTEYELDTQAGRRCFEGRVVPSDLVVQGRRTVVFVARDITERKRAEERIHLLASVFQHSGEAIVITDRENRIVEVNQAFSRMTGYAPREVMGQNPRLLASGRSTPEEYRRMWQSILHQGYWQGELWDRHKDGHIYPKWISISSIRDPQGEVSHFIANFTDMSEHKAAEDHIRHLANHDALTQLPNRLNLQARLDQALTQARREGSRLAVMFVDLDHFKVINDTLGHQIGDNVLVGVAQRLRETVRESDVVARLGGDEFVVVLTDGSTASAALVAEKLLKSLAPPHLIGEYRLHSTASVGISLFPDDGESVEALMKNADAAMYHAKTAGRNNYQFFTAEMNEAARERLALENGLRQALSARELVLHYQPQIEAASGRIVAVEALLRWRHPRMGLVAPARFIPVAEETGLIGPMGEWVLDEALRQLAAWRRAGIGLRRVAVNLSAQQLRDPVLPDVVASHLARHGLRGGDLELEVTESVAMHDPERSVSLLQSLHDLGVELAIDDFGTGYSSLAYLKRLPLDRLKLDRSFVADLETDANDAAIC
ncbi:MAG TPA: EAL domain-containing protein, partial [Rhodocyclaceae bacterium]|nr:EAL domain-containing protein [Rhodocyclaceae bacterium]